MVDREPADPTRPRSGRCRPAPLASELRIAITLLVRRLRWERSSDAITDGQYGVLAALSSNGPMTPTALAEDQHVQPPPMTRTINALVEMGLVRRDPHPSDRRQVLVCITDAGEAEVRETRRRRTEWLAQRLAGLSAEDRETLARAATILRTVVQP
ncbi:MAG: MarR family transcriptional regulator [Actinotalea sp.]|nr:MarR family transcriptional regulator [Actinotalea sp.]